MPVRPSEVARRQRTAQGRGEYMPTVLPPEPGQGPILVILTLSVSAERLGHWRRQAKGAARTVALGLDQRQGRRSSARAPLPAESVLYL